MMRWEDAAGRHLPIVRVPWLACVAFQLQQQRRCSTTRGPSCKVGILPCLARFGRKRIVLEQFYDLSHPAMRRVLELAVQVVV